ncbi:MAG: hypothetical protein JW917_05845 [Ignavibacteria bacterium]|nr:hypothetical protein [Ignavibacteria bacterium]
MCSESNDRSEYSRIPTIDDLIRVCRSLNDNYVKYIVIGEMAMINAGYARATEDIDLLIESSKENREKLKVSLEYLPDKAVNQMKDEDLDNYIVVKIADEFVIDLLVKAGGYEYKDISHFINYSEIEGVKIPFAGPELLYKLKKSTLREKDKLNLLFLEELLKKKFN